MPVLDMLTVIFCGAVWAPASIAKNNRQQIAGLGINPGSANQFLSRSKTVSKQNRIEKFPLRQLGGVELNTCKL
ncbi:MAG: hypothetical protein ACXW5W_19065 [Candidatus Binatia bacterium]